MDGILLDMDHLIEFYDLNAADGFGMYKKRQSIRRERRALKDEIFALDLVVDKLSKGVTIENLDCFIKSVQKLSTRQYHLRALSKEDVLKYVHSKKALCGICSKS